MLLDEDQQEPSICEDRSTLKGCVTERLIVGLHSDRLRTEPVHPKKRHGISEGAEVTEQGAVGCRRGEAGSCWR